WVHALTDARVGLVDSVDDRTPLVGEPLVGERSAGVGAIPQAGEIQPDGLDLWCLQLVDDLVPHVLVIEEPVHEDDGEFAFAAAEEDGVVVGNLLGDRHGTRIAGLGWASHPGRPSGQASGLRAQSPGSTRSRCSRVSMPSLMKTLCRWYSIVLRLTNSWLAISWLDAPSRAIRAIRASWGVRSSVVSEVRLRAVSPVARSSRAARSANAVARMSVNISCARRSCARASRRRRARRNHSP